MQCAQCFGAECGISAAQPQLRQPRAFAHQNWKRLRADLGVERSAVAGRDTVETAGLIGDHAGENVEPARRAFRIRRGRNVARQIKPFDQRHDIDASGLQHRAAGEREFVQFEVNDALGDGGTGSRQKTCADAVGDGSEAQVEACRLDLARSEWIMRANTAVGRQRRDQAVGQNSRVRRCERQRHGVFRCRSNLTLGLTQRWARRISPVIPWSFEPVGLLAT